MKFRFLLDEHLSPKLIDALLEYNKSIDITFVGGKYAPAYGTLDPDILIFCEAERRLLVTNNRLTMPVHIADHLSTNKHHWGVLEIRPKTTIGQLVEELYLFWETSEAEEWVDRMEWIPF